MDPVMPNKRFRPERGTGSSTPPTQTARTVPPSTMSEINAKTDWFLQGEFTLVICLSIRHFSAQSKNRLPVTSNTIQCVKDSGNREKFAWFLSVTPSSRVQEPSGAGNVFVGVNLVRRDNMEGKVAVKFNFSILGNVSDQGSMLFPPQSVPYKNMFEPNGGCWPIHNFIAHHDLHDLYKRRRLQFGSGGADDTLVVRVEIEFDFLVCQTKANPPALLFRSEVPSLIITRRNSDSALESSPEPHEDALQHKPRTSPHRGYENVGRRNSSFRREPSESSTHSDEIFATANYHMQEPNSHVGFAETTAPESDVKTEKSRTEIAEERAKETELEVTPGLVELIKDIRSLYKDTTTADYTIILRGEERDHRFRVHRVILQARSSRFREIISADPTVREYVLHEESMKKDVLEVVLEYMYCGKTHVADGEHLTGVMKAAHEFNLSSLVRSCESRLGGCISLSNAADVLIAADGSGAELLRQHALEFMQTNLRSLTGATIGRLHEFNPELLHELYSGSKDRA